LIVKLRPIMSFTRRSPAEEALGDEETASVDNELETAGLWAQPAKANERIDKRAKGSLFFIGISS
jgi:hypothetical protein